MNRKPTVIELHEVLVEPPLIDGARAWVRRLGLFSTVGTAAAWLAQQIAEKSVGGDPDDYALVYFVADEIVLDIRQRCCGTTVSRRDGSLGGVIPGGVERSWGGRPASECLHKPGDLVGFIYGEQYRVGVVLAQPPTPEEARRLPDVTRGDDQYLVGLLDKDDPFDPDRYDHDHVPQPLLFAVPRDVSDEMRRALRHRCLGRKGFPPWTEQVQRVQLKTPVCICPAQIQKSVHSPGPRAGPTGVNATLTE